ncbi:MAG: imidazolonepropionase [Opitutaceae bacterium]|jgi:imidazolonepropionase|nr:imidazolonepropionase [Opitutaceae bacterium]
MPNLIIRNARILTLSGPLVARRGAGMKALGVISQGEVLVGEDGKITAVGGKIENVPADAQVIDAAGRVVMPGFVDCHTHACWAGSRLDEWQAILGGETYPDILKKGGGMLATVRAVRETTRNQLAANVRGRLDEVLRNGTTTIEIKSGYGLALEAEIKMLRAIQRAAGDWTGTVVPTALLGHACEGSNLDDCVKLVVRDILPGVLREFPGIAIEAFCDRGAWTPEACVRLLEKARKHLPIRVSADQFSCTGMVPEAVRMHAVCVAHLESTPKEQLLALAESPVAAVLTPLTGLHLNQRFARGGYIAEKGGAVAIATNCNPGTSPSCSMPLAIATAVRFCGLDIEEAIVAATVNPAFVLGLTDRGTIEPGKRADLLLLHHKDERLLAYEMGGNPVAQVICGGKIVA